MDCLQASCILRQLTNARWARTPNFLSFLRTDIPPHKRGLPAAAAPTPSRPQLSNNSHNNIGTNSRGSNDPSSSSSSSAGASAGTAKQFRDQAITAQRRGDRRKDLSLYEDAVHLYTQALETSNAPFPADSDDRRNCTFERAECLQSAAELVLQSIAALSDDSPTILQEEAAIRARAAALLIEAGEGYGHVTHPGDGSLRDDAGEEGREHDEFMTNL